MNTPITDSSQTNILQPVTPNNAHVSLPVEGTTTFSTNKLAVNTMNENIFYSPNVNPPSIENLNGKIDLEKK